MNQTGTLVTAAASASRRMPEPPRTLTGEAYRRIEEMIVTLELAPAAVVSEAILSERIGIGTTPIREALQRLAREYLVQILPRRGVVVTSIDVRQQLQVLETRRELDRLIARAAARRSTPAERQRIAELADAMAARVAASVLRSPRMPSPRFTPFRAASGSTTTRTIIARRRRWRCMWRWPTRSHRATMPLPARHRTRSPTSCSSLRAAR